ncbi:unnamed protein product [Calicophoron daubneyi]|uniref:BTB domain-containing protein n=1 Tax=Calicophoron daubneyi TaxID=300641 RepID=A0AAV2TXL0_CALDB
MSSEWLSPLSGSVENSLITHNLNRRGVLFRSYRNLVSGIGGYESRISLHSSIPRASNTMSRSHHQNDLPPFWLQRSASARNLQSGRFGSVINLGETAPIAEDEPVNHVRENNHSFNAIGECAQPEHRRGLTVPHSAGPFESHFSRQLHTSQLRCPSDVDLAQRDMNPMESQYDRIEVSPAERSSHGSSPDTNDHTIIFTNISPWDSPSGQSTNGLNTSLSTSQIPLRTVNRQQLASRQLVRNSVPACSRPLVSGISGTLARPARSHIFTEPHSTHSHRLLRPPDAGTVDIARSTEGADARRPNSLMRGTLRSAGSPQRTSDRTRTTLVSSSAERTQPFLDREIRVIRRTGGSNQATPPRTSCSATNTQNLAGISASSSVEDMQPVEVVTTSRTAAVTRPDISRFSASSDSDDAQEEHTGTDGEKGKTGDWRTNCACSRDMWRHILESERFADVWFIVGGNQVLGNNNSISPCVVSPDSGAPGGPTSAKNYQNNPNRPDLEKTVSRPVAFAPENDSDTVSTNTFSDLPVSDEDANLVDEALALALSDTDSRAPQTSMKHSDHTPFKRSKGNHKNGQLSPPSFHDTQCISDPLGAKHSTSLQEDVFPVKSLRISRGGAHKRSELDRSCEFDSRRAGAWSQNKQLSDDSTRSSRAKTLDEDHISVSSDSTRINRSTETRRFGAHRLVLATASPVFEAMFYGPMAEMNARTRQNSSEYHITDIHPRAFQSMLTYIYSDEIELDDDVNIVFYVLYAAKKYLLPRLVRRCVHHLKGQITASNVCMMLDRSLFFDEEDLTRCCWRIIDVLAADVLLSPGLLTMDATNLKAMLQRDTLNCKESEVFAAVRRWSGAECARLRLPDVIPNRAQIAADLLRLVRFPTMTLNDFALNVAYSGFLSLEMVRDLFVHITTNKDTQQSKYKGSTNTGPGSQSNQQSALGSPGSVKTNTSGTETNTLASFLFEPRRGPKLWRCSRFTRTRKPLITSNPSSSHYHCVYFQTSAHIFLAGVGMYGSTQIGDQLAVQVELRLFAPRSVGSGLVRVASVGTQFQSSTDMSPSGDRRREHHQQAQTQQSQQHHQSGQEQQSALPRSSSLLEYARFDWSNRPQASGRVPPTIPENESMDANENNKNAVRPLSNTLAVAKVQLDSDGTSRVYDVLFPCPVKLVRGQRYALAVQASHMDRSVSVQSSSSAMNSATTYVGLFGRPEVRVCCCESKTSGPASSDRSATHSQKSSKGESTHKKKHQSGGRGKHGGMHTDRTQDVVFQFLDFPDENQHGEVERGFLPELLFYTFP